MRYAKISAALTDPLFREMPVSEMCRVFEVSASGYYEWKNRMRGRPRVRKNAGPPARSMVRDATVLSSVRHIRDQVGYTPGYRQLYAILQRRNVRVGVKRLRRLLRENGFIGYRHHRKPYKTTDSSHRMPVYPNLLERQFAPGALNRAWVSDITYQPTASGFSFLATFMDLGSRRNLGWAIDTTMTTDLVLRAFDMAVSRRRAEHIPLNGTIVHTDRGTQYCSRQFQSRLRRLLMRTSMSGVGQCWDNAPAEAIWSSLKRETLIGRRQFSGHLEALKAVSRWIGIYNRTRPHSTIGMETPLEYEKEIRSRRRADRPTPKT